MKTLIIILGMLVAMVSTSYTKPMHNETTTFKVYGNCGMCKKRIEGALKNPGIKSASWDVNSKMITVVYDPHEVSIDAVHKVIADVGHDTDKVKANSKTYDGLMGCCQYERSK